MASCLNLRRDATVVASAKNSVQAMMTSLPSRASVSDAADGSNSKEGFFYAVSIGVPRSRIYETVKEIRKEGGSGVLVFPLTYVFDEEPPRWNALMNHLGLDARDYEHLKVGDSR